MVRTLIVAIGIALAMPALAQSTSPAAEGKRAARFAMVEKLGLSNTQAEQVKSIMKAARQQRLALKAELQRTQDRKLRRAIKERMQASRLDTRQKLSQVLSAEQLRKYDATRPTPPRRVQAKSA